MKVTKGTIVKVKTYKKRPESWNHAGQMDSMMGKLYKVLQADSSGRIAIIDENGSTWSFTADQFETSGFTLEQIIEIESMKLKGEP